MQPTERTEFSVACPNCGNSCIRPIRQHTIIDCGDLSESTRLFACNDCAHRWSEYVATGLKDRSD